MNQPYVGDAAIALLRGILTKTREAFPIVRRQALIYFGAQPQEKWQLGFARVTSVPKAQAALKLDYGKFIYEESYLSVDEALSWFSAVAVKAEWKVAGNPIEVDNAIHFTYSYEIRKSYVPYSPCHWLRTRLPTDGGSYPHDPLIVPNLDIYPNINALLHDKFGVGDLNGNAGNFNIYLPPYEARIGLVKVKGRNILVQVPGAKIAEGFAIRVWGQDSTQHMSVTSPLAQNPVKVRLKSPPQFIAVYLVDKTGVLIDGWESGDLHQATKGTLSPQAWLRLIAGGESDTLEFKNYSNPPKNIHHSQSKEIDVKEVANQLVAFTNSLGGTVFLGVHDDSSIRGVDDVKVTKAKITEAAHGLCDPKLTPKLFTLKVGKHTIVGATVERGKGIHLSGSIPYIRRNATTRKATAAESTELINRPSQQITGLQGRFGSSPFGA